MWQELSLFSLLIPLAVVAWYSCRWAVLILLAALSSYIIRTNLAGIPTTWLELGIYIVFIIWLVRGDWRDLLNLNWLKFWPWLVPLLVWLASCTIGVLVAEDTRLALGIWKGFIIDPLILCLLVASVIWQRQGVNWWRDLLAALLVGAVATTAVALLQTWVMQGDRLQSGFDSPNVLAMYLAPILVLSALWLFNNWQKIKNYQKALWGLACLIVIVGVYLTNSYTSLAAVTGGLVFYFIIKRWPKISGKLGVILILFSLLVPIVTVISQKSLPFGHTNEVYGVTSGQVRQIMWQQALEFIKAKPVLGLGLGQWQDNFISVAENKGWLSIKNPGLAIELHYSSLYPHNLWLTTWLFTGLLGLISLWWIVIKVFQSAKGSVAAVAAAGLFVQILHGTLDTPLWKNDLAILWWLPIMIVIICEQKLQFEA